MVPVLNQSSPHSISLRSILILSFHLCIGFLSCFFPSCFLAVTLYAFLISPVCDARPAHLILHLITLIFGEAYKLWSSSLCSLLQPTTTSSLLGPNILSSVPCSQTLPWNKYVEDVHTYYKVCVCKYRQAVCSNISNSMYCGIGLNLIWTKMWC